jgi:hypothetical protein
MMKKKQTIIALMVSMLSVCCASNPEARNNTLFGMIYDIDGSPVKGALLSLGEQFVCTSDANGRFMIGRLSPGHHAGSAEKPGFECVSFSLDFRGSADILYIKIPSKTQILALAERAIKSAKWEAADAYIKRAVAIEGDYYLQWFHAGVLAVRFHEASVDPHVVVRELERIVERGVRTESLFSLIGDLHQYRLGDGEAAIVSLGRIPERDRTQDVRDRIAKLEAIATRRTTYGY